MSSPLKTPVVIITGAGNGIGFFLAKSLLENGFRVAGLDLSGDNLAPLHDTYPELLRFYQCDVTDAAHVKPAVDSVIREWDVVDILVNNACLAVFSPFEQRNPDDMRREMEVNYFGYLRMIWAVLPCMKARRRGIIHNVSSSVGITGFPGVSGYASSKGAIEAMTRTLAIELEPLGITVNLIYPPLTHTKSAAPLGVPPQAMEDAADVGRKLAKKIQSTSPIITPDFKTAVGLFATRHFPGTMAWLMGKLAQKARQQQGT